MDGYIGGGALRMAATMYPWSTMDTLYSIAGKFDGELNWRFGGRGLKPPNQNLPILFCTQHT